MIVVLRESVIIAGVQHPSGALVTVTDQTGRSLLERGLAERETAPEPTPELPLADAAAKLADASVHFQLAAEVSTKETTTTPAPEEHASEDPVLEAPASEEPVVAELAPASDASSDADDEGAELHDEASDEATKSAPSSRKRRRR